MSRDRKMPKDPGDPRRQHDPGRGLRSHVADAGVPVQPERPDLVVEAAESDSGPCAVCTLPRWEHDTGVIPKIAALTGVHPHEFQPEAEPRIMPLLREAPISCPHCPHPLSEHLPVCEVGMHSGKPCGCAGLRSKVTITSVPEGPRPPVDVAEAIRWIESLHDHRIGEGHHHRTGTGPAYRAEGEASAFEMVLNLLKHGDPEGGKT